MSHIFPIEGQKHFDLHAELTELGGKEKETFRLAFAWDGEHFMEVTDDAAGTELYGKWVELHGGDTDLAAHDAPSTEDETAAARTNPSAQSPGSDADPVDEASAQEPSNAKKASKSTPDISQADESATSPDTGAEDRVAEDTTDNASAEPPEDESTDEPSAATDVPDFEISESTPDSPNAEPKAGSSTSGTPRKRSAKNSTRRS